MPTSELSLSVMIPPHLGLRSPLLTKSYIPCGHLDEGVPIPSLKGPTCTPVLLESLLLHLEVAALLLLQGL